ncbi:MAG: adenylate/guanylate cyclase domain-containing protein [Chloroflexi bacterium]|nr:adenylate/guanylate cyclase domain-containing protein [Chloroflexota bacterium]
MPLRRSVVHYRLHLAILAILLLVALGGETIGRFPGHATPLETMDYATHDFFMRVRGTLPAEDVVVVAIDDASFAWTGYQWPWPRAYLAKIVNAINQGDPAVVGLDILLAERSDDPAGDQALAEAVAAAPHSVLLVRHFRQGDSDTLAQPWPALRDAATYLGISALSLDEDAVLRRVTAYTTFADQVYYNWAFYLASLKMGIDPPRDPSPSGVTFNGQRVPLENGMLLINYAGPPGTFTTYSAVNVAEGDVLAQNPDAFRDKVVLIGVTSPTLQDIYPTPFSATQRMAGVEVVANAVETLIHGNYLRRAPLWVDWLLTLLAVLFAWGVLRWRSPWRQVVAVVGGLAAYMLVAYLLFLKAGLYIAVTGPSLVMLFGVLFPLVERAVAEEMEKRRVRQLFSRFISPKMVEQLLEVEDLSALNRRAELSILFSDIRNFTTLSEKLTPEEVVSLLNPYLEAMTAVIHRHGGTVDKYEGDAILAFFGAPLELADHPKRAVRAALEMREALKAFKEEWTGRSPLPEDFDIGIGISTGEVFVGLLGPEDRLNYTVIGDHVNLAARLQDATKRYGWPILISETTAERVADEFALEFVEAARLKGKTQAVGIYKVLGLKKKNAEDEP